MKHWLSPSSRFLWQPAQTCGWPLGCGPPTAREAACLLVKGKASKGQEPPYGFGAGALTYARQIAGEIILGAPMPSYTSKAMEFGTEYEATLRDEYSFLRGDVEEVGIIHVLDSDRVIAGISPDGLVGEDGLAEIKTRAPEKVIALFLGGDIPNDEYVQGQFGLWMTGRKWIDHVAGMPPILPGCISNSRKGAMP